MGATYYTYKIISTGNKGILVELRMTSLEAMSSVPFIGRMSSLRPIGRMSSLRPIGRMSSL